MIILKILFLLPVIVFLYQMYKYAVTRKGMSKESACLRLGITYTVGGIFLFVFRSPLASFLALLLLMLGLLLLASGLQRKDKKVFIDHFDEDDA